VKITTKHFLVVILALFPITMIPSISATNGSTYDFVLKWGSSGTEDGQFHYPYGVAVDSNDNIYVTDVYNYRVQKFDSSGGFLLEWGSNGTGEGQFDAPWGVAVDSNDNVYVTDFWNYRVQKFDSSGGFITKWGSFGTGDGQFNNPIGVALDSNDNIYVSEYSNHRVQKFDSSGGFITKWGTLGTGDGQFNCTQGVAVDSNDNVYVNDFWNHRVQKFDSSGGFITKWGTLGTGDGQFNGAKGLCVDLNGNIFISDYNNHRVQKFDSSGGFITKWGSFGTGDGQFDDPIGVAIDSNGNIYVADSDNNRIQKFMPIDTTAPTITVISPENNASYGISSIPLNYTVSESVSWMGYSLDGQANVTVTGNTTLVGLLDGLHSVVVYGNDTVGNMGASGMVYFAVDTTPPNITAVSQTPPEGNVLPIDEVEVNATVMDDISGVKQVTLNYTIGDGTWIAVAMTNLEGNVWNGTIPPFEHGTNVTYTIVAEDNVGHIITTDETNAYQYHVVPEFHSLIILPLFMIATFLAIIFYRKHTMPR
jgi:streptogramin lyase